MHFAYPPRKSSNPPPFRPAQSKLPSIPILRRSRLKIVALVGLAIVGLIWILSGKSKTTTAAYKDARNPSGTPPVVIVTVLEENGYGQDYIQSLKENRERYAKLHGYKSYITTPENFDLHGAPPSWSKVVAMRHALMQFPDCKYIWYLEQSALIIDPSVKLERDVMGDNILEQLMIRDKPVVPPDSIIKTFSHLRPEQVQLALTMDKAGMSEGSLVLRNGDWAEFFLDTWYDPLYRTYNFQKAELHALEHIIQWHPTILSKLALIPQRTVNSYAGNDYGERYKQGDFVVRFPGCTAQGERSCMRQSKAYMDRWREAFAEAGA